MNDRYRILSILHEYPFGRVCVVEDQIVSKHYVAKELYRNCDPLLVHQFHVEVDVLSSLRHTNVPEIIDVFEMSDSYVLIESYIEGVRLDKWLKEHKKNRKFSDSWMNTCFDVIEKIHEIGFLYIDLKLENLIVCDEIIYLIDFNACISFQSTQVVLASDVNTAPEYKDKKLMGPTSDIYGIGGLLKILYPRGLKRRIANKCLKKDSQKRYQNIMELRKAFNRTFYIRKCLGYGSLILSVLLLSYFNVYKHSEIFQDYRNSKDPTLFIGAYGETLEKIEGNQSHKVETNLYEWINNDWIYDEVYQDREAATFILKQAILSKNPSLCSYFLKQVPESIQKSSNELVILMNAYLLQNQDISYDVIHEFIISIENEILSQKQTLEKITVIMNVVLDCEIILQQEDLDKIYQLQIHLDCTEVDDLWLNLAKVYVNYGMLIKNEPLDFHIPESYYSFFDKTSEVGKLMTFLEGE